MKSLVLTGRTLRRDDLWVAFIEEIDGVHGVGTTREDAIENVKLPFAEYIAERRRGNEMTEEVEVTWFN